MAENVDVVIAAHGIADGNPSTAMAAQLSAEQEGIAADLFVYPGVSQLVRPFHQGVTADPERAAEYIQTSEAERAGLKGKALGALSLPEFAYHCMRHHRGRPIQWNLAQELPLRSAPAWLLEKLTIVDTRVLVPDVFPKETAVDAVMRHGTAQMSVWNQDAFDELRDRGVNVELNKPYLLDGFRPKNEMFAHEGRSIVAKVSGSGAPPSWINSLESELHRLDVSTSMHTPSYRVEEGHLIFEQDFCKRMRSFYDDLGSMTRILIGYPSELVGVACELRARGVPVWMLALPPRGLHEYRNLEFAHRHGIVFAELDMSGTQQSTIDGLQLLRPSDISSVLQETPESDLEPGLLGKKSIWE